MRSSRFWDGCSTVSVINFHVTLTIEVLIEHTFVAVVLPPGAQLSVPRARQHVKQLFVLHVEQSVEILITQMTFELEFFGQSFEAFGGEQRVVEGGRSHLLQVEQQYAAVEACETIGRRLSHSRARVLPPIHVESVTVNRLQVAPDADDVRFVKKLEAVVKQFDVVHEFQVGIEHDNLKQNKTNISTPGPHDIIGLRNIV